VPQTTREQRLDLAREMIVVARRWRTRLDERLKRLGVSEARWAALYWLWRTPGEVSQTMLAERTGVESPTLVRTLDLLCDAGLVQRRTSPRDRRAKLVTLTPAALPLIEQIDAEIDMLRQVLMADLTADEVAVTLRVMRKMRGQLDNGAVSDAIENILPTGLAANEPGPAPMPRRRPAP
jgi:MarR family transcriptional regulator for hemolysin